MSVKDRHSIVSLGALDGAGDATEPVGLGSFTKGTVMIDGGTATILALQGSGVNPPFGNLAVATAIGATSMTITGGASFAAGAQDIRVGDEVVTVTAHAAGSEVFTVSATSNPHKKGESVQAVDVDPRSWFNVQGVIAVAGAENKAVSIERLPKYARMVSGTAGTTVAVFIDAVREVA